MNSLKHYIYYYLITYYYFSKRKQNGVRLLRGNAVGQSKKGSIDDVTVMTSP